MKKVLIISTWAPPMIGGPMNLYNLYSQYNPDSYCVLTSYGAVTEPPYQTEYWLPGKYFFYDRPDLNESNNFKKQPSSSETMAAPAWYRPLVSFIQKVFKPFGIGRLILMIPYSIPMIRHGRKVIKSNAIDVLMGISGDGLALLVTYILSKLTRKPYAVFLFDIYKGNNFTPALRLLAKLFEPRLIKNASRVIVTNDGTAQLYIKRYPSLKPEIVYNAAFPDAFNVMHTPYHSQKPYSIVFTGNIYWPQERSILNIIKAILAFNDENYQLYLYAPEAPESVRSLATLHDQIHLTKAAPSDMPSIQTNADILLLPLSWSTPSPEIIQTATPGKLTDYLISGRPILVHAPPDSYVSYYCTSNQCGYVVDTENTEELQKGIITLLQDPTYAQKLITNAKKVFYQNHDARKNAEKLTQIIDSI